MAIKTTLDAKIDRDCLWSIASQTGPCLTLMVPDSHPGAVESSRRAQMEGLVREAKKSVLSTPGYAWPADFEHPLEEIAESLFNGGGPGRVLYLMPDSLWSCALIGETAKAVLSSHPYVMPLLMQACSAQDLFLLGLSKKHVRLLEYVSGRCVELDLPARVPPPPAADNHPRRGSGWENRTPAGPGVGKMGDVRFGTADERQSATGEMEHFCAQLDQALRPLLKGRPLLLMGVKEEIAAYRRVSQCDSLLHTEVDGNVETFSLARIETIARKAAAAEYGRLGEQVLAAFREMRDRARTAPDPQEVLKAAAEGRVHKLCLRERTVVMGPLDAEMDRVHLAAEDLINAAAVETVRHGGDVFVLPPDQMSVTESACAILRY
jgi:hypothetical protein